MSTRIRIEESLSTRAASPDVASRDAIAPTRHGPEIGRQQKLETNAERAVIVEEMEREPRQYLDFDPQAGYPAGADIAYECTRCAGIVSSMPRYDEPWQCACKNVRVDGDAGRVSVRDHSAMKVFRRLP